MRVIRALRAGPKVGTLEPVLPVSPNRQEADTAGQIAEFIPTVDVEGGALIIASSIQNFPGINRECFGDHGM